MLHVHGYYRLLKATVAIERTNGEKKCFQVPEGSTLLVNCFEREGPLVEVIYDGRRLLMFDDDLVIRTQALGTHQISKTVGRFVRREERSNSTAD